MLRRLLVIRTYKFHVLVKIMTYNKSISHVQNANKCKKAFRGKVLQRYITIISIKLQTSITAATGHFS